MKLFNKRLDIKVYPDEIVSYLDKTFLFNKKTPIDSLEFTVIDTETTGIQPAKNSLISFAGIRVIKNRILITDSMDLLIRPDGNHTDEAIHIHEISTAEKEGGKDIQEALLQIVSYIKNTILVGFHINFDIRFLNESLKKKWGIRIQNPVLDISNLLKRVEGPAQKIYPDTKKENLDEICRRFQIPVEERHTASGDAMATAIVFLKLLSGLDRRAIHTWGDLK